jgi:hypothetical protein
VGGGWPDHTRGGEREVLGGPCTSRWFRPTADVLARIKCAKGAFGCLRRCLFSRRDVTYEGKRKVYEVRGLGPRHLALHLGALVSARERGAGATKLPPRLCPHNVSHFDVACAERYSITNRELLGRLGLQTTDTYLARQQLQWLGHVWRMDWSRLPRKLLTAWVPVEEKWVGGCELTWGEGVEEVLKRASHAFPSVDDGEPTLRRGTTLFVPQSLVVGGSSSGRGALTRSLSGNGGGAPGEAKQRPRPYFVSAVDGCYCRDLGGLTGLVCQVVQTETAAATSPAAASAAASTAATTTATAAATGSTATQTAPTPTPTAAHAVAPAKQPRASTNHPDLHAVHYQQQLRQWSRRRRAVRRR